MVAMLHDLASSRSGRDAQRPVETVDARITTLLADHRAGTPGETLRALIAAGLDRLPMPGAGRTLQRWRALESVARHDLALVKLYESHTDALAILREVESREADRDRAYAVWASESRTDPVTIDAAAPVAGDRVTISGRKSWCSGASVVDAGLMTATDRQGSRHLVEIAMNDGGLAIDDSRWHAVGMHDSGSFDIVCDHVNARIVGRAGSYLERHGFWHGGAGIAACWYGAAAAIGDRVRDLQVGRDDVHALAHLGAIDTALASAAALLREAASAIDAMPSADAMRIALRVRGAVADLAAVIIDHAGRAVGPGPLCNERDFARRVADLPIFVRQSRAEHDRVAQARALLADARELAEPGWRL